MGVRQELLDRVKWENGIRILRREIKPVGFDSFRQGRESRYYVPIADPVARFEPSEFPIESWTHEQQVETWLLENVAIEESVPHYIYVYVRGDSHQRAFHKYVGRKRIIKERSRRGYGHCLLECIARFVRVGNKIRFTWKRYQKKKAPYLRKSRTYWLYKFLYSRAKTG